jgi:hypothetical protein
MRVTNKGDEVWVTGKIALSSASRNNIASPVIVTLIRHP